MQSKVVVVGANSQLGQVLKNMRPAWFFVDRQQLELTQPLAIRKYFSQPVETLVNFAAFTAVDAAETNQDQAKLINIDAAEELAKVSRNFIHISTDYVFDGLKKQPYVETDPTHPINFYGRSKRDGEVRVMNVNPHSIIFRTSWLYSEYRVNFVKRMLELAQTRKELKIVNDQLGTPTSAADLVRVVIQTIESPHTLSGGIYHYSNEGQCSWYDLAKEVFHLAGLKINVVPISTAEYPTPARRPMYSVLDKTKIKSVGFHVPDWRESLLPVMQKLRGTIQV